MTHPTPRSDAKRKRHRRVLARGKPDCHWCGRELKFTGSQYDPAYMEVDHVVSVHLGGSDEIENKVASCRACNRRRSWHGGTPKNQQPKAERVPYTYVTERCWTP